MNARLGVRHLYRDLVASASAGIVVLRRPGGDVALEAGDVDAYLLGEPLPSQEAKRPTVERMDDISTRLGRFGGKVVAG